MSSRTARPNPYRWDSHVLSPEVELRRDGLLDDVSESVRRGNGVVLLGGRGMGKSIFLRQLAQRLRNASDIAVFALDPPVVRSVEGAIGALAQALDVAVPPGPAPPTAQRLLEQYLAAHPDKNAVALLYDELDQYAAEGSTSVGRLWFDHLELARKNLGVLGIVAAGGLGVYLLRHSLSSNFLSRARWFRLLPFTESQLVALATPRVEGAPRPSEEVLEALRLASGGNPALATYGLEASWDTERPTAAGIAEIYAQFEVEHREFVRSALRPLQTEQAGAAPARVLAAVREAGGEVSRARLLDAVKADADTHLDLQDVVDILESSGLVRVDGSLNEDPVRVRPIPSLLTLDPGRSASGPVQTSLVEDVVELLARMHAMGVDLLTTARSLLPEAVYSAFLGLGLRLKAWETEREAQHGGGRTDLKARRRGEEQLGIVEAKLWERQLDGVQEQVAAYWSRDVVVGVVVVITERAIKDWPEKYRTKYLEGRGYAVREEQTPPQLAAHFVVQSATAEQGAVIAHHLLLRLPSRGMRH